MRSLPRVTTGDSGDSDVTTEQIFVKHIIDEVAMACGMIEEMSEWVDLDTDVRLLK